MHFYADLIDGKPYREKQVETPWVQRSKFGYKAAQQFDCWLKNNMIGFYKENLLLCTGSPLPVF